MRTSNCTYHHFASEICLDCEECLESILYKICYHCAPALAGLKPANMLSFGGQQRAHYHCNQDEITKMLPLQTKLLKVCEQKTHVLVYQEQSLAQYLFQPEHANYLRSLSYDMTNLDSLLDDLVERFKYTCPHEVGLFLGYPLSDVLGFQENLRPCLLTGYWKVYSNLEQAKITFQQYDQARQMISLLLKKGFSPSAILLLLKFKKSIFELNA